MKTKAILVTAIMVAACFAFVLPAESDDAAITSMSIEGGNTVYADRGKDINFTLKYFADRNDTITVKIFDISAPNTAVWTENVNLIVNDDGYIYVDMSYNKNAPQVQMKITFTAGSNPAYNDIYFTLSYNTSIWDNWAVYGVIIALIVAILALVLFKSRYSSPKEKNTMTFEQIEAQKNAQKVEKPEKKAPAVKSERQRYLDSKKKKE